jgi:hypothetical protein
MDEYYCATPNEHQIRFTRKVSPMQFKTITENIDKPPHYNLRCGVLRFDGPHYFCTFHIPSFALSVDI